MTNLRLLMIILAGTGFLSVLGVFLVKSYGSARESVGYLAGINQCSVVAAKEVKKNDGIRQELRSLDDTALIKRYCLSSVSDVSPSECMSKIRIIR